MLQNLQLAALAERLYEAEKAQDAFYPVAVPDGVSGGWKVKTAVVGSDEAAMNNIRHAVRGNPEFIVSPGEYKVLVGPMGVMMSNTQLEYRTNRKFIAAAHGDILILGLGLGMVLGPLHEKPEVKSITVVELEPDVVNLVLPTYEHLEKLEVVMGNAFEFQPTQVYDHVFHDIWPDVGPDNLKQMWALEERYQEWALRQWFWSKEICERMNTVG